MITKRRIFEIIEKAQPGDIQSEIFDISLICIIILNIAAVIINSFNNLAESIQLVLQYFEYFSIFVFTIEYGLRIWTANFLFPNSKHPHIRFIFSLMAVVDLLAILPFYLPFIVSVDLRILRILRLFRLLRVLKLNRYNDAMALIGRVLKNEKDKLGATVFIILILLLFSASIMYYIENEAQPDKFPNILAAMWWAVATLTTVGYGDVYPVTTLGKILGGVIVILGIGLIALPTGIISSGFVSELEHTKKKKKLICPHCGKEIDEE